jgi:polyferredoxin
MMQLDVARLRSVRPVLINRWPQFLLRAVTLAGFVFTITAGLIGTQVGSANFAIIFVWIAWWSALKLAFIPAGGRSWCSICPIPMPAEWLQRGALLEKGSQGFGLKLRWPKRFKNSWLQSFGFLVIGLFSAVTLTSASVTAWALLGILLLALVLGLVFERRAFCSHVCPIGGFTGLYAQAAPVELRVKDRTICAAHEQKVCYDNCPWGIYPLSLKTSADCGLCMECLRVCEYDNIAVNFRSPGADLSPAHRQRLDETFFALVMLSSALMNEALFLGPWGSLKSAAFALGSLPWLAYAGGFLALSLLVLPGLFALAVWAGQKLSDDRTPLRQAVSRYGKALVPLGLLAWVAFTISFAFANAHYIVAVLNDPLGWGWNLLGLPGPLSLPDISSFTQQLQIIFLAIGVFWSSRVARMASSEGRSRAALPVIAFCALFCLVLLWLLIG